MSFLSAKASTSWVPDQGGTGTCFSGRKAWEIPSAMGIYWNNLEHIYSNHTYIYIYITYGNILEHMCYYILWLSYVYIYMYRFGLILGNVTNTMSTCNIFRGITIYWTCKCNMFALQTAGRESLKTHKLSQIIRLASYIFPAWLVLPFDCPHKLTICLMTFEQYGRC